jgi:hypothetical protein
MSWLWGKKKKDNIGEEDYNSEEWETDTDDDDDADNHEEPHQEVVEAAAATSTSTNNNVVDGDQDDEDKRHTDEDQEKGRDQRHDHDQDQGADNNKSKNGHETSSPDTTTLKEKESVVVMDDESPTNGNAEASLRQDNNPNLKQEEVEYVTTDDDDYDDDDDDSHIESEDDESEVESDDESLQEEIKKDVVHDEEEEEDIEEEEEEEEDIEEEEEEEEQVTSFVEKQSLLVLAAEHDRVDILKAILTDKEQDNLLLMNSGIPPLHIAITFGSTNATQSLLRMGADPSIRPNVARIQKEQQQQQQQQRQNKGASPQKVVIANMRRFDGVSAWELAFGTSSSSGSDNTHAKPKNSWSLFGSSSSKIDMDDDDMDDDHLEEQGTTSTDEPSASSNNKPQIPKKNRTIVPVHMAPSKREGIRHAFTAEALRCIGGDDVDRLRQLLDSGMPPTIDIGGKDLYAWAVEMGALCCEELLRPIEAAKHDDGNNANDDDETMQRTTSSSSSKVLDRSARPGDEQSVPQLINRLDELESLARALSTCLDNLAEEVSVCHGLLLMGGGASALAAHVKSLKTSYREKMAQLEDVQEEWERSEDELADLVQQAGHVGQEIAKMAPTRLLDSTKMMGSRSMSFKLASSPEEQGAQQRQLHAQLAASANKVRRR